MNDRRRQTLGRARTTEQIAATLTRNPREYMHRVDIAAPVQYRTKELPVDPYVLGRRGSETARRHRRSSPAADEAILEQIGAAGYGVARASGRTGARIGGAGHTRDAQTGRYARNESLSSRLRDMELLGNKHIPVDYMHGDVAQRQALLEGLMDTDGYDDKWGRCEFTTVRRSLADEGHGSWSPGSASSPSFGPRSERCSTDVATAARGTT